MCANMSQSTNSADGVNLFAGAIIAVQPTSGDPLTGASITVFGAGFSPGRYDYSCKFECKDSSVSSMLVSPSSVTSLVCTAPIWPGETCTTKVTIFRSLAMLAGSSTFTYEMYWASVTPSVGANGGGTILAISGAGLNSSLIYACVFEGLNANNGDRIQMKTWASYSSTTELICLSPQWPVTASTFTKLML